MTKRILKSLPKLDRLLIDVDMKPTLLDYLRVVGFDVAWAKDAKVNYRSDRALVAFARHYHRILVCHDKHKKPQAHKIEVCLEIYENGGQVLQVAGSPSQDPLTSLGKILGHRQKWRAFFQDNDGIVTVYENKEMAVIPRKRLLRTIQGAFDHPSIPIVPSKSPPRAAIKRKAKPIPIGQQILPIDSP